jgi:outer membrane protein assembly factor BamB
MRAALATALLAVLCSSARAERGDWPFVRGDLAGTATIALPGAGRVTSGWQFSVGSHIWAYQPGMSVWSSAAIGRVAGRAVVIVGSYDNNVYCLDAASGEKRWRFTTGGGVYAAPVLWRGRATSQRPARALVFAGSSDRSVYALDADLGRREWIYTIEAWRPTMGGARLSSPAIGQAGGRDLVFVGHWVWDKSMAGHQQAGGLTAIDAATGKRAWTTPLGDNQLSSPIVAPIDGQGRAFIASENGNLYAVDASSGKLLWTHGERDAIKASPALFDAADGPRLVIGSKFGRVRCLDARSGRVIWRFKAGHWIDGSAAIATVNGRAVVFIGSYDNNLYALDGASGAMIWSYRTAGGVYSSPAVVGEGVQQRVLFSSWDHHLHCVAASDGALIWKTFTGRPIWDSVTLGDSVWASPSVAVLGGEPQVYFGSYSGPLYAMSLASAARQALPRHTSNWTFWVTLPLVMAVTAVLTLVLTWRHRRLQRLQ